MVTATKSEALVTITNKRRRMKTFNLEGEHMRARTDFGYRRLARVETVLDPKTGIYRQKRARHSAPSSITFLARETKVNVPAAILQCPEIKAAWKERGDLKVVFQDRPVEVKTPEPKPRKTVLQLQKEEEAEIAKAEAEAKARVAKATADKSKRNGGAKPKPPAE